MRYLPAGPSAALSQAAAACAVESRRAPPARTRSAQPASSSARSAGSGTWRPETAARPPADCPLRGGSSLSHVVARRVRWSGPPSPAAARARTLHIDGVFTQPLALFQLPLNHVQALAVLTPQVEQVDEPVLALADRARRARSTHRAPRRSRSSPARVPDAQAKSAAFWGAAGLPHKMLPRACVALLLVLPRICDGFGVELDPADEPGPALCVCAAEGGSPGELHAALLVYSCPCRHTAPPIQRIGVISPGPDHIGVTAAVQSGSGLPTSLLVFAAPLLVPARQRLVAAVELDHSSRVCGAAATQSRARLTSRPLPCTPVEPTRWLLAKGSSALADASCCAQAHESDWSREGDALCVTWHRSGSCTGLAVTLPADARPSPAPGTCPLNAATRSPSFPTRAVDLLSRIPFALLGVGALAAGRMCRRRGQARTRHPAETDPHRRVDRLLRALERPAGRRRRQRRVAGVGAVPATIAHRPPHR